MDTLSRTSFGRLHRLDDGSHEIVFQNGMVASIKGIVLPRQAKVWLSPPGSSLTEVYHLSFVDQGCQAHSLEIPSEQVKVFESLSSAHCGGRME